MNTVLTKHDDVVGPMAKALAVPYWNSGLGFYLLTKHHVTSYSPIVQYFPKKEEIFLHGISLHHRPLRPQMLNASGQVHGSNRQTVPAQRLMLWSWCF